MTVTDKAPVSVKYNRLVSANSMKITQPAHKPGIATFPPILLTLVLSVPIRQLSRRISTTRSIPRQNLVN